MKKTMLFIALLAGQAIAGDDPLTYSQTVKASLKGGDLEYFIEGKKGAGEESNRVCEDGLFFNDHYLAVFDGATDKSGKKYDGKKGGRVSRDIILGVFENLPPASSKEEVLKRASMA